MTDRKMRKIIQEFRRRKLNGGESAGWCQDICIPLAKRLKKIGYEVAPVSGRVNGEYHYWIEYGSIIIDPTADQFTMPDGKPMPKIYIGPQPSWYRKLGGEDA